MRKNSDILIRCVGIAGAAKNKVQWFAPYIAFNESRMRQIGYIVQDPELENKRKAMEYLASGIDME